MNEKTYKVIKKQFERDIDALEAVKAIFVKKVQIEGQGRQYSLTVNNLKNAVYTAQETITRLMDEMGKEDTPYTLEHFFYIVWLLLRENGKIPENVEYTIVDKDAQLRNYEFDMSMQLCETEQDGPVLDIFITGNIGRGDGEQLHLCTITTLTCGTEGLNDLALLGAEFIAKSSQYVDAYTEEFLWEGYSVRFFKEEGEPSAVIWCKDIDELWDVEESYIDYAVNSPFLKYEIFNHFTRKRRAAYYQRINK